MGKSRRTPIRLHPEFLCKNGKKELVVLSYDEFLAVEERLQDADDLMTLRQAAASDDGGAGVSLPEMKRRLAARSAAKRKHRV